MLASPPAHSSARNAAHPHLLQAGAAYRSAPPPPPEFTLPSLPPHLEAKLEDDRVTHNGARDAEHEERGVSDAGRLAIDSSTGALQVAHSLAAQDEQTKWYWTFDGDGKPVLACFNPNRISSDHFPTSPPPPKASTSATPGSTRLLFPPQGNRGFKLRSPAAASWPSQPASSTSKLHLTSSIPQDDEIITSQAPRWNAFGRLAPWTTGMTGPLTGQGEEEVGPQAWIGGDEGEVGERRPRRGDRETNDRLRLRIAALQRAGVRSLLTSPPPRHRDLPGEAGSSNRRRSPSPILPPSGDDHRFAQMNTSSLAPTLLQPVLSPLQLLESRTLTHTFRNPHIEALAKTTLDLAESESQVKKAVGGFWAALEEEDSLRDAREKLKRKRDLKNQSAGGVEADVDNAQDRSAAKRRRSRMRVRSNYSPDIVGAAGSSKNRSKDELNPTFVRLEELFITHEDGGLKIPLNAEESDVEDSLVTAAEKAHNGAGSSANNGSADDKTVKSTAKETSASASVGVQGGTDDDAPAVDAHGSVDGPADSSAVPSTAADATISAMSSTNTAEEGSKANPSSPTTKREIGLPDVATETIEGPVATSVDAEMKDASPPPSVVSPAKVEIEGTTSENQNTNEVAPSAKEDNITAGHKDEVARPSTPAPEATVESTSASALASTPQTPSIATVPGGPDLEAPSSSSMPPVVVAAQPSSPTTMILPPSQQREIMLAALSCLTDLEADSKEYAQRLEEVRGRLVAVVRKRDRIWRGLRIWSLERLKREEEEEQMGEEDEGGVGEDEGGRGGDERFQHPPRRRDIAGSGGTHGGGPPSSSSTTTTTTTTGTGTNTNHTTGIATGTAMEGEKHQQLPTTKPIRKRRRKNFKPYDAVGKGEKRRGDHLTSAGGAAGAGGNGGNGSFFASGAGEGSFTSH